MKKFLLIMPLLAILLSCNKDEAIFQEASPVIELDSEDGYYIVKVGATLRVSPAYKNVDEAFKIAEKLDNQKYEIWFMSYQGKPKNWYRVDKFLHRVPYGDVPGVYLQCDILLKTSILESFSYPPLEMMATGGYVVAVPNDGNAEYLRDGENCLFYTPKHLQTAVQAVARITDEPQLRERLYENGIATAAARDWEKIRGSILRLYGAGEEK